MEGERTQSRLVCYCLGKGFSSKWSRGGWWNRGCRLCEIAVCWEMFSVNSRVISGLFDGTVDCFIARDAAVSRGPDKDYFEEGKGANEV